MSAKLNPRTLATALRAMSDAEAMLRQLRDGDHMPAHIERASYDVVAGLKACRELIIEQLVAAVDVTAEPIEGLREYLNGLKPKAEAADAHA